jgi:signal peptidase II
MGPPRRATYALVAAAVVAADQASKLALRRLLPLHHDLPLVNGLLSLRHGENAGVAFGFLSGAPLPYQAWLLSAVGLFALVALVAYALRLPPAPRAPQLALALVMGGAAGNLVDRVRLGTVVDFIHVYWGEHQWPDFNIADSAITVGVVLLVLGIGRSDRMLRS